MARTIRFSSLPMLLSLSVILSVACREPATPSATSSAPPVPAPARGDHGSAFVDRVWRVESSNAVAIGTTYVFVDGGVLLITGPGSTPAHGSWKLEAGRLTMIEEGLSYPTEILELAGDRMRLRMSNPGEPVELALRDAGAAGRP
jgi:hypothetical protein